ncbi:MAG TPA: hypothetical protein VFC18_23235 [Burkholderiales bacterium]|nr:hypothetical protein [Burkholderiales bacterium]
MDGKVPPPPIAETLGLVFKHVDAGAGTIEVEFTARPEFSNRESSSAARTSASSPAISSRTASASPPPPPPR